MPNIDINNVNYRKGFLAEYEVATKHLTEFQKGEIVQVTDKDHRPSNFWFEREFIQEDSDGQFACRQNDGGVCRWDYIRKIKNVHTNNRQRTKESF